MASAEQVNREFYEATKAGQNDYWRKMAAPRFRVRTIAAELAALKPESIVDIGCGGGQLLAELSRSVPGAKLVGVDLSEPQLALNREQAPHVRWVQANLDAPMKWSDEDRGKYDAVTAVEIIEHLDRPDLLLENIRGLLRPNGRLVLSTQSGPLRETERRVGHRRHFTRDSITSLLQHAGLEPERVWNAGFPFHDLSKWYANVDPDASMSQFGDKPYGLKEDLICLGLRGLFRVNSNRFGAQLFAVARAV
ncbi:MAG: class I SAM-dependent methyltransferase [Myxococcaceae bacterium]|nr:class I SAM-dependent methyltransferase [Myxococcaceae bacterium]